MGPDLQKISIKLLLDAPGALDPDGVIEIFGRWRTEEGEELVDLADYAHLAQGPLVVLIGKRYNLSVDTTRGRPGILYSTKKGLEGDLPGRFREVIRQALKKASRLLAEPGFPPGVRPRVGALEVVLNDRILFPNDDATDREVRPALEEALARAYGEGRCSIRRDPDPGRRLAYEVSCERLDGLTLEGLLSRLHPGDPSRLSS